MLEIIISVIGIVSTGVFGLISWFVGKIYQDLKAQGERFEVFVTKTQLNLTVLEREFGNHRVEVAKSYVARDDMAALENKIITQLNRIEDKLDNKADK